MVANIIIAVLVVIMLASLVSWLIHSMDLDPNKNGPMDEFPDTITKENSKVDVEDDLIQGKDFDKALGLCIKYMQQSGLSITDTLNQSLYQCREWRLDEIRKTTFGGIAEKPLLKGGSTWTKDSSQL